MEFDSLRKLPASIEAEQSVLGAILINPECFSDVAAIISAEDFYLDEHREIFNAMRSLFMKSKQIDPVVLVNTLVQSGVCSEEDGLRSIHTIAQVVPSASNVRDYAAIVREKSVRRRLIQTCEDIAETAYTEQGETQGIVDHAEQLIFDIAQNRDSKEFRHIHDVISTVYDGLERQAQNPGVVDGTKTGFADLDRVLVQMGKGDLVLIGARPGMGKTSFAMNIATNAAKSTKKAVCVFSLEMPAEQLVMRMLSSEALVNSYSLRSGEISSDDWEKLADAAQMLSECDIYIDDTSSITATEMKAKLRRVKNLGLVVIDYLQLMQSGRPIDNRVQEVADISRNLKLMAKELGVPIICCAQLSRGPESRTVKKPMLSDLRDSGAIEQDADIVIFLYREEYYRDQGDSKVKEENVNTAEVIIAKNRHGSQGTVKMGWNGQFTKFRTLEMNIGEPQS